MPKEKAPAKPKKPTGTKPVQSPTGKTSKK